MWPEVFIQDSGFQNVHHDCATHHKGIERGKLERKEKNMVWAKRAKKREREKKERKGARERENEIHFWSSRRHKLAMYIFDSLGYTHCSTKQWRKCIINLFCMHNEVGTCKEIIPFSSAVAPWLECLAPDRVVRVRVLAGDIVLCSWARHFTLTVPLSTQVYKWVPMKCWG